MKTTLLESAGRRDNYRTLGGAALTLLSVLTLGLATGSGAQAALVVADNTANKSLTLVQPGTSSSLATGPRGWSFTTGANAVDLTAITMGVYSNGTGQGNVGLALYAGDDAGGALLESLTPTLQSLTTIGNPSNYLTFSVDWGLAANTQYAIAATYATGGTQTARLAVSNGTMSLAPGITGGSFFFDTSSASDTYAIRIEGNEQSAVPEPSTLALFGLSLGVFAWMQMPRRRKGG